MRKSIAVIAVVGAIIASYVFFIMPLSDRRAEIKDSLEAKYVTIHKYETYLKAAEKTGDELDAAVKEINNIESYILQDTDESLAFVRLQGYIKDFADKSGIKILSIKPLSVVKYKHYANLPVQLEASGVISQLSEFMRHIDKSKRLLRIDKLNINVTNIQMPSEFKIKMQVSGLMKI
jgi:Tfp pilus assembly protein PilO